MSTFKQLVDEVLYDAFDDAKWRTYAGRYVNDAQRKLARRATWGRTLRCGTVDAEGAVTLGTATTWARIAGVWRLEGTDVPADDLWRTVEERVKERLVVADDIGRPGGPSGPGSGYQVVQQPNGSVTLIVRAPVGEVVAVRGYRAPTMLVNDSDVCELGDDASEALISFARSRLYKREDDPDMQASCLQDYEREAKQFVVAMRPQSGARVIEGMWACSSLEGE